MLCFTFADSGDNKVVDADPEPEQVGADQRAGVYPTAGALAVPGVSARHGTVPC